MRSLMTMMDTPIKLVSVTPDAEKLMAYVARVSNPKNQGNDKFAGLLKYCIQHGHWSVFEQAFMTVEINTTRGLAAQILRHRSHLLSKSLVRDMLILIFLILVFLFLIFAVRT